MEFNKLMLDLDKELFEARKMTRKQVRQWLKKRGFTGGAHKHAMTRIWHTATKRYRFESGDNKSEDAITHIPQTTKITPAPNGDPAPYSMHLFCPRCGKMHVMTMRALERNNRYWGMCQQSGNPVIVEVS